MNRHQARAFVKDKYGPGANVINVSCKNRNERFGVVIYVPGGATGDPTIGCLGYGHDYDSAINGADQNPVAQQLAKRWIETKADYQEFKIDPIAYKKRKTEQMEAVLSKNNADMASL